MNRHYVRDSSYGIDLERWAEAKKKATEAIGARIRRCKLITHGELYDAIKDTVQFPRHHQDERLRYLLGQISEDQDDAGRGLIGAVVVRKDDSHPGRGWYKLAEQRGREMKPADRCWAEELMYLSKIWFGEQSREAEVEPVRVKSASY